MKIKKNSEKKTKKLKESEEQYRRIIENIPDVLWTADYTGETTFISSTIEELLGYTSEEIYENSSSISFGRIHPEDFDNVKRSFNRLFEDGSLFNCEYRIKRKDEKWIWVHDRSVNTYKREGELYADGILTDITVRKQIEDDLKSSEERLKIIFEFAPDAIYLNDLKGNFLDGNKAAEELIGYKREEIIGKNFLDLKILSKKDIPKAIKNLAKNVMSKKTGPDEFIMNRKDGSQISLEISNFPVKIEGRTVVLGVARDISERKKAEDEIIRLKEGLEFEVEKKTKDLKEKMSDLQRFYDATVERELRMEELYNENERLKTELKKKG